jgi:hypothetical protein
MLLYERGRGGDRADTITFMCKCLFIMRVSEISCEVVEEGPKEARTEVGIGGH